MYREGQLRNTTPMLPLHSRLPALRGLAQIPGRHGMEDVTPLLPNTPSNTSAARPDAEHSHLDAVAFVASARRYFTGHSSLEP